MDSGRGRRDQAGGGAERGELVAEAGLPWEAWEGRGKRGQLPEAAFQLGRTRGEHVFGLVAFHVGQTGTCLQTEEESSQKSQS